MLMGRLQLLCTRRSVVIASRDSFLHHLDSFEPEKVRLVVCVSEFRSRRRRYIRATQH